MGADGRGALDIDIQDHILALAQLAQNFGFEGPVTVAVNSGVFEKIPGLDALEEGGRIEEKIIYSVLFGRPGGPGSASDSTGDVRAHGQQLLAKGGFAAAGWGGDDD